MVIQHNISALNAHRSMGINNSGISKNLEKLSSGYKVNRAADDAAGLAISEKMRGQVRGLAMAEQNTSQGINLIQTAEGGLNETHAILQRMRELAVQSSNGTFQDEDREQLTKEFSALKNEVDRIATSTHYNGIKLLNGNLDEGVTANVVGDVNNIVKNVALGGAAQAGQNYEIVMSDAAYVAETKTSVDPVQTVVTYDAGGVNSVAANDVLTVKIGDVELDVTMSGATAATVGKDIADAFGTQKDFKVEADAAGKLTITANKGGKDTIDSYTMEVTTKSATAAAAKYTPGTRTLATPGTDGSVTTTPATLTASEIEINGEEAQAASFDKDTNTITVYDKQGNTYTLDAAKMKGETEYRAKVSNTEGKNLTFQIGANGGQDQRVDLQVANMSSFNIGLREGDIKSDGTVALDSEAAMLQSASIGTIDSANKAIEIIHAATNQVSGQRAELGALQNRMESALNSLGITKENLTAAESTIRDTDMAKEMMDFTKNNILVQASQAMLAQANQLPQGVLQLLR